MASPASSDEDISRAKKMLNEIAARKAAKLADRKTFWEEYHEQLDKSVEHDCGSRPRKIRGRVFRYQ